MGYAGHATELDCELGAMADRGFARADVRETYRGENGTFEDECDADGNLIAYECEIELKDSSDPSAGYQQDGAVTSNHVDCHGSCVDGACENVCPALGDSMRYLTLAPDGSATFQDETSGWQYACKAPTSLSADYDCTMVPMVGDTLSVAGTVLGCPSTASFTVGESPALCLYSGCSVTPP